MTLTGLEKKTELLAEDKEEEKESEQTTCEFCNEMKYEHEILNAGGFKLCEDCAEEIVDAWNRRYGKR